MNFLIILPISDSTEYIWLYWKISPNHYFSNNDQSHLSLLVHEFDILNTEMHAQLSTAHAHICPRTPDTHGHFSSIFSSINWYKLISIN